MGSGKWPPIPNLENSDLCEVTFSFTGLRAAVHLGQDADEEDRLLEIVFKSVGGFRYLDEGDLLPYWSSAAFENSDHLIHEIKQDGWAQQEERKASHERLTQLPAVASRCSPTSPPGEPDAVYEPAAAKD